MGVRKEKNLILGQFCKVKGLTLFKTDDVPLNPNYPFMIVNVIGLNVFITAANDGGTVWKVKRENIVVHR